MSDTITCPQCQNEIEVTEVMSAQLADTIRGELQAEYAAKTRKLATDREELAGLQKQMDEQQTDFDQRVKDAVAKQRESLTATLRVEAQQAVAVDIKDQSEQLKAAKTKIDAYESTELELRKKSRELEERVEKQELEVTRRIDEERQKVREAALKQGQEEASLKIAERDQKITALGEQLRETQRKLEQGSQQTQGETLENALESLLKQEFPCDVIEPVAKGTKGGDILQHVFDSNGRETGIILWESKRTKHWQDKWVGKAIDDQQEAKATCTCIVTTAMPDKIEYIGEISGVWVASWACARSAAVAIRRVLIEAALARVATEGQHDKMELVYNYLSGTEFRNRVRGLIEPYMEMEKDLQSEMRVLNSRWKKRRKLLDRAILSISGLHGDLQGIIGTDLQEIEVMEMLALEATTEEISE